MIFELIILDGYGYFVWPAFIFTFASCIFLYIRTKKEFKLTEKVFLNEFAKQDKFKDTREEKISDEEALSPSSI